MNKLYTVADIATAWKVTPARIRQLIDNDSLIPDYCTDEPRYYWTQIPARKEKNRDKAQDE